MDQRAASALALLYAWACSPAAAQNVYFGNLHAHTSYSDGTGKPAEAFEQAKAASLDFMAITEHNHPTAEMGAKERRDGILIAAQPALYNGSGAGSLVRAAASKTREGSFVALYGQEFSTIGSGNHVNVLDAPSVITAGNGEFDELVTWLRANPDSTGAAPIVQFNHPRRGTGNKGDYGRDDFANDQEWVAEMGPHVSLIEVLNAPAMKKTEGHRSHAHEREYFSYLNLGFKLGPSVGHDNHYRTWGTVSDARVGVVAPALTKADILAGLRARRTFASDDKNLRVIVRANGGIMGDVVPAPAADSELDLTIEITDPDEPTAEYRVDVFVDAPGGEPARRPTESFEFRGDTAGPRRLDGVYHGAPGEYMLVRLTQYTDPDQDHEEEDRLWTAPIWFEATAAPAPRAPTLRLVSLLADPLGLDVQNEELTVANTSAAVVGLAGWQLRDLAGNYWTFDPAISIQPGGEVTLRRDGQPLSLNNDGDTVELLAPDGMVTQTFTYGPAPAGSVIPVP